MDKIQIANILLTQRCNLNCSYCHLTKNYMGKPVEYPDMKYYAKNELTPNEWIKILRTIKHNNPKVFFIFYGGEPFLYDDLFEIIDWCHDTSTEYTIISNNTDLVQKRLKEMMNKLKRTLRGFTSSVDPIIFHPNAGNSDRYRKSLKGLERLLIIKRDNLAKDVVAEITVDRETVGNLYAVVKMLSEGGIYSSITCIDQKKSPYYDFSGVVNEEDLVLPDAKVKEQFKIIQEDKSLLVHMPAMLNELFAVLPCRMKCNIYKNIHNVTISPDGRFRLCLRIRGVETPKLTLDKAIDNTGEITQEFKDTMKKDYVTYCAGCNHTCLLMSSMFADQIIGH